MAQTVLNGRATRLNSDSRFVGAGGRVRTAASPRVSVRAMRTQSRRRLDKVLIAGGALVVGAVALIGAVIGDTERIREMWVSAQVNPDGSAQVVEVIDYDFGYATDKHGIFREVPGLSTADQITVSSEDAPDDVSVESALVDGEPGVKIRIGNPGITVSGRHRYRIEYHLPGVATERGVDWDAVGTGWDVPIEKVEVHVAAPFEFAQASCFAGGSGSTGGCDVEQTEPGVLAAEVSGLDSNQGMSIEAERGQDLAADQVAAVPAPPGRGPKDKGTGLLPPAGGAAAAALLAAIPAVVVVRRAGRERVAIGGAADAAYAGYGSGGGGPPVGEVEIDQDDLEAMATTDFAPPEQLTPPQGGIVLAETVRPEHKTAWLIQAAIDGAVDMQDEGGKKVRLTRTGPGRDDQARILDTAFDGDTELELGKYNKSFATAWSELGSDLDGWRRTSGLWDERASARRIAVLVLGIVVAVIGALVAGGGGAAANRWGGPWIALAGIGGIIAGVGIAAAVSSWELRVRTAAGSAAWLRVESFRRFLAGSEAYHAEEAAKRGVLREYTAWALAVGEIDRWERAVSASSAIPQEAGLGYVYMAPILVASTTSASTAPSSSGGGGMGGFSGSVGGGAGGGGGGSW
jgi:predicted membrane protein DUF2207